MSDSKYIYDPDNINFNRVDNTLKRKIFRGILFGFSGIFLAVALAFVYTFFFDTPRERQERREYKSLSEDYALLSRKFERIDTVLKELSAVDQNIYRTIFETEPMNGRTVPDDILRKYEKLTLLANDQIVQNTTDTLSILFSGIKLNFSNYRKLSDEAIRKKSVINNFPAIQPVENKDLTRLASGYGYRMHPFYDIPRMHTGIDFTAPVGTEVYATGNGVVREITRTGRGHGNTIVIDHGSGYETVYSHLSKFNAGRGKRVNRGDIIGWVGNTGLSTAPHLHYEVHLNGKPVNPVNYFFLELGPREYDKIIELSVNSGQSFD